jgi:glyoxylase-like metal-dependent hydrolase (beta-lactamase superfamily II)
LPPDAEGRIQLSCRCLLLEHQGRLTLFETGIGVFFQPALRERYGVLEPQHVLIESLAAHGILPEQIHDVVLSHLHFDHAGGLLSAYREAEESTLLFSNARFIVGQDAFERAKRPHLRDRASFIPGLPALLEASGRLELITGLESGLFKPGPLGAAVLFTCSNGHTPGMLHAKVSGREQSVFFCADLVPGKAWIHLPITMGYDRSPETLIDEKARLFSDFEQDNTWLYFCHDPAIAMARIGRDAKGHFGAKQACPELSSWFDLDAVVPEIP